MKVIEAQGGSVLTVGEGMAFYTAEKTQVRCCHFDAANFELIGTCESEEQAKEVIKVIGRFISSSFCTNEECKLCYQWEVNAGNRITWEDLAKETKRRKEFVEQDHASAQAEGQKGADPGKESPV